MFRAMQRLARTTSMRARVNTPKISSFHSSQEVRNSDHIVIASGVMAATAAAGAFVIRDYNQAKNGTKVRDPNAPLNPLDFLYVTIERDEKKRRKLGLIPEKLFKAGQNAISNGENPDKWFKKMLSVTPNFDELPFYEQAANIYLAQEKMEEYLEFCEHIHITEPEKLAPYYEIAGNVYFKNKFLQEAETNWMKAKLSDMPKRYAYLAKAYREQNNVERAIFYFEEARKLGYQPPEVLIELAHVYLKINPNTHSQALELFKISLSMQNDRDKAIALNEMGVCIVMSAVANTNQFNDLQLTAINYFKQAAQLFPDDDVIKLNLEITMRLNKYAVYGKPHEFLQCAFGKPTSMFEAVKSELERYKTKKVSSTGTGVGVGVAPTYNNGSFGLSPVVTSTDVTYSMNVPVPANAYILAKLEKLKLKHMLATEGHNTTANFEKRSARP